MSALGQMRTWDRRSLMCYRGAECVTRGEVRCGSKADILAVSRHVRFTPESGHSAARLGCPLCAKSRHWELTNGLSRAPCRHVKSTLSQFERRHAVYSLQ
jgi:hypothetical protein